VPVLRHGPGGDPVTARRQDTGSLLLAVAAALDGRDRVCASEPGLWFSDDLGEVAEAIDGCHACPAMAACGALADVAHEKYGVWGGQHRDGTVRRRLRLRQAAA